ncbi:uncharacterized protein MELLADRAFT_95313 [Melampsora larici-populina 98AG31]|uniref:Uncharacterized protein n=1 Tax=Melampsora larici-populina (strain 98AG31 / pathotype 3-4-7) TaxID=747676 RepID=F4RCZ2_MELLP|nr:uncharacterized protein MELLADRAFT_95313 [Melampsora larici-populina 98AG31]EGG09808.1 hypothetical protein MELLADRAFT_95313 [Melampsora larici-populina 98AG31]
MNCANPENSDRRYEESRTSSSLDYRETRLYSKSIQRVVRRDSCISCIDCIGLVVTSCDVYRLYWFVCVGKVWFR